MLKRGFKHVFCVVLSGECWFLFDGCNGVPVLRYIAAADFDVAGFYRDQGYRVVETTQGTRPLRCPMVHANCVGFVKAVLAIRCWWALTPYCLYRHLTKDDRP